MFLTELGTSSWMQWQSNRDPDFCIDPIPTYLYISITYVGNRTIEGLGGAIEIFIRFSFYSNFSWTVWLNAPSCVLCALHSHLSSRRLHLFLKTFISWKTVFHTYQHCFKERPAGPKERNEEENFHGTETSLCFYECLSRFVHPERKGHLLPAGMSSSSRWLIDSGASNHMACDDSVGSISPPSSSDSEPTGRFLLSH